MKPKKILYLENGIGYGGAVICMKLLAANLNRDKYYPIIVTSRNEQNYRRIREAADWLYIRDKFIDKEKLLKIIESIFQRLSIKGRFIAITVSAIDYLINLCPYLLKLLFCVKKEKVDLIHLNNEPVCNMAGVLAAWLLKIPCVGHVRGPTWNSRTSRWLYRRVDYFITASDWVKKEVLKLNVHEDKIRTVWDGREIDKFVFHGDKNKFRESLDLKPGQFSVGMVGLLNPWKGHKVFIEAAEKVLEQFPDCKLFIIGGPAEKHKSYESELKSFVCEKGLEKNLVFTGHRRDVTQVMGILDVIVHASIEPDPYPNVVIEGMFVGKPIIATNIGGPPEMIENYKTGILIPPKDPAVLAEKICYLLRNPDLRLSIGEAAKKVASGRNSIKNHVRQIEEIYEKVLNKVH